MRRKRDSARSNITSRALTKIRQLLRIVASQKRSPRLLSCSENNRLADNSFWMDNCLSSGGSNEETESNMMNPPMATDRTLRESAVIERFLESPNEESFADIFRVFTPKLVAFFRSRGCEFTLSEDLTQEVMLTVYGKAAQVRDRSLFSRLAIQDCAQCPLQAVRQDVARSGNG